jgi:hypothetical protein
VDRSRQARESAVADDSNRRRTDMTDPASALQQFSEGLARARDEIKLKIHLGSKELQDEWADLEDQWSRFEAQAKVKLDVGSKELQEEWAGLEDRWNKFEAKAKLEQGAKDVADSAKTLAAELKEVFDRVRKAF